MTSSPTCTIRQGDARDLGWLTDESIHLVVTSPPYWTLKKYNDHPGQLGDVEDYETFMDELDKVWGHCYRALVPGGRLACVIGDVCIARRQNKGRHMVVPLHADIAVRCRRLGYDYLTPVLWHKIANAQLEATGNGSTFLGKPYEPNAIIKNDIEYVLMLRKPGAYRKPTEEQRRLSKIGKEDHARWFRSMWTDVPGASHEGTPRPLSTGTGESTDPHVLVHGRYGSRPVRRHRHDASRGRPERPECCRCGNRPEVPAHGPDAGGACAGRGLVHGACGGWRDRLRQWLGYFQKSR